MQTYKKMKQLLVILPVTAFLFLAIGSCNNSGEKKDTADSPTMNDTSQATNIAPAANARKTFFTVKLTKQNLQAIFNNDVDVKMVYCEFETRYTGGYSLRIFGADKEGQPVNETRISLDTVGNGTMLPWGAEVPPEYSEIFTRGHLKDFLGLPGNTNTIIDEKKFPEVIWMTPCMEANTDRVLYKITRPSNPVPVCDTKQKNARDLIYTNPSPPGNPCLEECDTYQFRMKYDTTKGKKDGGKKDGGK